MTYKKTKIFAIVLIIIGVILIISGLVLGNTTKKTSPNNNSDKNEIKEDQEQVQLDDETLANNILKELSIDDFVGEYLTSSTEKDKNLLDLSSADGINRYFLANKNIEKYILVYENPLNLDMIYIKYSDFINKSKEVFNKEPTYDYKNMTMQFPNITKTPDGKYQTTMDNVKVCDLTSDTKDCYVLIGSGTIKTTSAEFSSLKIENNIITGEVKKYYDINDKATYMDGTFELEFEKIADRYIIKSFKII